MVWIVPLWSRGPARPGRLHSAHAAKPRAFLTPRPRRMRRTCASEKSSGAADCPEPPESLAAFHPAGAAEARPIAPRTPPPTPRSEDPKPRLAAIEPGGVGQLGRVERTQLSRSRLPIGEARVSSAAPQEPGSPSRGGPCGSPSPNRPRRSVRPGDWLIAFEPQGSGRPGTTGGWSGPAPYPPPSTRAAPSGEARATCIGSV